jgi:hypothetical protein
MAAGSEGKRKVSAQHAVGKALDKSKNRRHGAIASCPTSSKRKKISRAAKKQLGKLSGKGKKAYARRARATGIQAKAASKALPPEVVSVFKKAGFKLKRIDPKYLHLMSQQQAWSTLKFFFGKALDGTKLKIGVSAAEMNVCDRQFAMALLIEAVDASYHAGFLDDLVSSLGEVVQLHLKESVKSLFGKGKKKKKAKGTPFFAQVLKEFATRARERWFEHANGEDLLDPHIYELVRLGVQSNFALAIGIRKNMTGDPNYCIMDNLY